MPGKNEQQQWFITTINVVNEKQSQNLSCTEVPTQIS